MNTEQCIKAHKNTYEIQEDDFSRNFQDKSS